MVCNGHLKSWSKNGFGETGALESPRLIWNDTLGKSGLILGGEEGNVTQAHGTRDEKPRVNPGYSFADNSWQSHHPHHPHSGENYWVIHKRKGLEELKRMFLTASGILSVRNEPLWRYLTLLISET